MPSCAAYDNPNWFSTAAVKCEQLASWLWDRYAKPEWTGELPPTLLCDKHAEKVLIGLEKLGLESSLTQIREKSMEPEGLGA